MKHYIGVDVGTGSARVCISNEIGEILVVESRDISKQELQTNFITQSSNEIWDVIVYLIKRAVLNSKIDSSTICGISFDATCSLVLIDKNDYSPVGVGPDFGNNEQNIILWMDHRAQAQTDLINSFDDPRLKYVGGKMSVEFQLPKIKWLKDNLPSGIFNDCMFMDLADFLTFKATGCIVHSFSSSVCKQGLLPYGVEGSETGWSESFLTEIGLQELVEDDFRKLGGSLRSNKKTYLVPGDLVSCISSEFSASVGLLKSCAVGTGIIDAYAGWVGSVAADTTNKSRIADLDNLTQSIEDSFGKLTVIAGTSTCHILLSKQPYFVPGVWGPYRDVLAENLWAAEGGQSCTGALLDNIIKTHPVYRELLLITSQNKLNVFEFLNQELQELCQKKHLSSPFFLTKDMFIYGDFHGNRSPLADPLMNGIIVGQTMDTSINDLCLKYLAACEFIALQTRHIIETLRKNGHYINSIYMSGGQCKNNMLMELITNCSGLPVVIPKYVDSAVVFGASILGSVASKIKEIVETNISYSLNEILWSQMRKMTPPGCVIDPLDENTQLRKYLQAKYEIYLDMIEINLKYRNKMNQLDYK